MAHPVLYRHVKENPMFASIPCPVCNNGAVDSLLEVPYGVLKRKPNMDYSVIGVGPETLLNVDRCPKCKFVFANPRVKPEFYSTVYNESKLNQYTRLAARDDAVRQTDLFQRRITHVRILLNLIHLSKQNPPITMLDVGAGLGHSLSLARELGIEGYGTEIDKQRLSHCQDLGLRVLPPDEFNAQHGQMKFNIMVAQAILEHVGDVQGFVSFLAEKAKPGAVLYINGLTPDLIDIEQRRGLFARAHFVEHINYFPPRTLDLFMGTHGFKPIRKVVVYLSGRPFFLPQALLTALLRLKSPHRSRADGNVSRYYRYVGVLDSN